MADLTTGGGEHAGLDHPLISDAAERPEAYGGDWMMVMDEKVCVQQF